MAKYFIKMKHFHHCALGIEAASFWSAAEKDIAESPTAQPERPREMSTVNRLELKIKVHNSRLKAHRKKIFRL